VKISLKTRLFSTFLSILRMPDQPFLAVTSKKRRNRRQKTTALTITSTAGLIKEDFDSDRAVTVVKKHLNELKFSDFYKSAQQALGEAKPQDLICFGLGTLSSYISKYQLAFSVLLQEKFNLKSQFSDPCFWVKDVEVLRHFDCKIIEENLEGKFLVSSDYVTLAYLPHCPKQLVNNFLWKNFDKKRLENVILITNSFQGIVERTPSRLLQSSANLIEELSTFCEETLLPNFESGDIFNDLSVIVFKNLPESGNPFWNQIPEPVYTEDVELIQK